MEGKNDIQKYENVVWKRRLFLEYDYFFKYNLHVKCEQNAKIPAQKIMW